MRIEHLTEQHRFITDTDSGSAELDYDTPRPGVMELYHTFVPPAARGNGVASALVEHAVRYARDHDQKIIPSCSYVRGWISQHPQAQDLVAQ